MKKNLLAVAMIVCAMQTASQAQNWIIGGNANGAASSIGNTTNQDLKLITNNVARMTVTKAGKVGIGVTAPTATLQVQKSALADVLIKSTGATAQITLDRPGNGMEAITRYTQTGVPQWKTGLMVNAFGSPDYVINNAITNNDALTISGNNNSVLLPSGYLALGTNGTCNIYKSGDDLAIRAVIPGVGFGTPGNINLAVGNFIGPAGKVGIGTNDPSLAKLVVQGSTGNTIALFRRSATGTGVALIGDAAGVYFNMYYNGGHKAMAPGYGSQIYLDENLGILGLGVTSTSAVSAGDALSPGNALLINSLGNVGIGVNPAYRLDVCGTMRATEVRVEAGWCDYVFANDYKLRPLNEVESFIKENKHLPDVTKGADIESNGLEVGKVSSQMIRKIEELTLYIIDQQKLIAGLQNQVDDLKKINK